MKIKLLIECVTHFNFPLADTSVGPAIKFLTVIDQVSAPKTFWKSTSSKGWVEKKKEGQFEWKFL